MFLQVYIIKNHLQMQKSIVQVMETEDNPEQVHQGHILLKKVFINMCGIHTTVLIRLSEKIETY